MKNGLKIVIIITLLMITNVYASGDDINLVYDSSVTENEVKLNIISPMNKTNGILADIEYDDTKLSFKKCYGDGSISVTSDGKRIVIDSPNLYANSIVATCLFNYKTKDFGDINLSNVEISKNQNRLVISNIKIKENGEVLYYEKNDNINTSTNETTNINEKVTNPKTGVKDLSILMILITISGISIYKLRKNGKFFKGISIVVILLIPISTLAVEINATDSSVISLRNFLIKNGSYVKDNNYDHDGDGYVTINDLVMEVEKLYEPEVTFTNKSINKGDTGIYYLLEKNININAKSKILAVSECLTKDGDTCISNDHLCFTSEFSDNGIDKNIIKDNCNNIDYSFKENKGDVKLCINITTADGINYKKCDNDVYTIDPVKPLIEETKDLTMSYSDYLKYDPSKSINVTYGISSGSMNCSSEETSDFVYSYSCKALGNNGLSSEINYKVTVTPATKGKTAIFLGDSITNLSSSWATYKESNNYFTSVAKAGFPNYAIGAPCKECSGSIITQMKNYINNKYDYVILQGGFNDLRDKPSYGTLNFNDFSGDYDVNTWIGALESYIYTAKTYWPNAKLGFIITYATPLYKGGYLSIATEKIYVDLLKDVMKKWNVEYFDLFEGTNSQNVSYQTVLKVNTNTYLTDDIHLSSAGFKLINSEIYDWINRIK